MLSMSKPFAVTAFIALAGAAALFANQQLMQPHVSESTSRELGEARKADHLNESINETSSAYGPAGTPDRKKTQDKIDPAAVLTDNDRLTGSATESSVGEFAELASMEEESFLSGNLMYELRQRLVDEARDDEAIITSLISLYYHGDIGSNSGLLIDTISEIGGSQVDRFAGDLLVSPDGSDQRVGLKIMSSLDGLSEYSSDLLFSKFDELASSDNVELIQDAIDALPETFPTRGALGASISLMTDLSRHPEEEVRHAALVKIGLLSQSVEDISPVLDALDGPDRFGAIEAIYRSQMTDDKIAKRLLAVLSTDSDSSVQGATQEILRKFALSQEDYLLLQSYVE
jgi:hypothetical protein